MAAESGRLKSLDVLRAAAVLLVLGRHADVATPDQGMLLCSVTAVWWRGGWIGVDLFFVLSGFLIAGLLFREQQRFGEIRVGRFFIRRGLKIYPPFFVLLAATIAVRASLGVQLPARKILGEISFLQNYLGALWNHTWSLAVEEHFYLMLPIVLVVLARRSGRRGDPFGSLPLLFVVLSFSLLGLRIYTAYWRDETGFVRCLCATHLRIDSLAFGVLCSYFFHYRCERFSRLLAGRRPLFAAIGVILLMPAFVFRLESTPLIYTLGLTGFYIGGGALLCSLVSGELKGGPLLTVLAMVGAYSYSIYLWHMPVKTWGIQLLEGATSMTLPYAGRALVYFAGSVIFGILMGIVVEYPVLRLRDRYFPSRSETEMPNRRPPVWQRPTSSASSTRRISLPVH